MTRIAAATPEAIARAGALIRRGGLVAFPTETVYGLGADATNDTAVARIFAAKRRPDFNPLIVHVAGRDMAAGIVQFDDTADRVAARFWPGALTLVLPRTADCPVSRLASAGLETIAVRAPDHPIATELLAAAGFPIAAPSANRSGRISPTTAAHVAASLGDAVDLILDGGPCRIGLESTVLDLSTGTPTLLRPGGVPIEDIAAAIGPIAEATDTEDGPKAPGMLASHYAPAKPLRLDVRDVRPGEALLSFGRHALTGFVAERNLSPSGDPVEAAANLFAMLHEMDGTDAGAIAVMAIPEAGLGRAINDRLRRAAAPRPVAAKGALD